MKMTNELVEEFLITLQDLTSHCLNHIKSKWDVTGYFYFLVTYKKYCLDYCVPTSAFADIDDKIRYLRLEMRSMYLPEFEDDVQA